MFWIVYVDCTMKPYASLMQKAGTCFFHYIKKSIRLSVPEIREAARGLKIQSKTIVLVETLNSHVSKIRWVR